VSADRWSSGDVRANGVRLHWTRTGGDLPKVALVHGLTDDGLCWTSVAKELEGDCDLAMIDARGHGRSEAPPAGYDPMTMARDLLSACDALDFREPVLVGHSMGAVNSLVAAALRPDGVRGIFLEDPPGLWARQRPAASKHAAEMRARIEGTAALSPDAMAVECHAGNPRWSDEEIERWVDGQRRVRPEASLFIEGEGLAGFPWPDLLAAVKCPVRLALADPAVDSALADDALAALREYMPRAEARRFTGSGHSVHRDEFVPYMGYLREFLRANAH
jgi:pimeloyl-ACP methyl ester carboxylesterase